MKSSSDPENGPDTLRFRELLDKKRASEKKPFAITAYPLFYRLIRN